MKNKVEILAPAGSYETFKAVINAGADAVYLAGNKFGARAYANNFSKEELISAINYANLFNRRVYLTVNTLLKNNEIKNELYEYIKPLYEAGLHGVIVQDYGVMDMIHNCFPGMEIHASTQMTITDNGYFDLLKKYNVTRLVPAREMSLVEIKKLHESTGLEIESFIHGALCYCYSGMCFMSSFIGGRSGNRGRCAGTCRLEYKKDGKNSNLLSLKDLCTLNIIPDLIENGVFSMKIEGRMKSPEYASGVTSIYRKYVDLYLKNGREKYWVDDKDVKKLLMLFDRGGLTEGYYYNHNGKDMIANAEKSDKSLKEKKLLEESFKKKFVETNIKRKINATVTLYKDSPAIMTIFQDELYITVEGEKVSKAMNRPMTEADIRKQISKLGDTVFEYESLEIMAEEDIFVPNKALNELRRNAIEAFEQEIIKQFKRFNTREYSKKINKWDNIVKGISVRALTFEQCKSILNYEIARLIISTEIMSAEEINQSIIMAKNCGCEVVLSLPAVDNKAFDNYFYDIFENNQQILDGVLIHNISQLRKLKECNFEGKIYSDYTIYGFNDIAANVIKDMGVDGMTYPVELNEKELSHLNLYNPELLVYGKIPLMFTANCVDKSTKGCHKGQGSFTSIIDRKNAILPVLTCCKYCYNIIYNSVPIFLLDKINDVNKINFSYLGINFTNENANETDNIMKLSVKAINKGEMVSVPEKDFTRGHFTRGVE